MAGAIGPVWMGKAFDATGSYQSLLTLLSVATLGSAALLLLLPAYPDPAAQCVIEYTT
jgi:cyanate permease